MFSADVFCWVSAKKKVENEWSAELERADEITRFLLLFAVVLLDTTKEDSLDWTRYPFGPQSATPGVSWTLSSLCVSCVCVGVYVCVCVRDCPLELATGHQIQ